MPPYAGGGRAPAGVRSLPTVRRVSDCPSAPALAAVVHHPAGGSLPLLVTPWGVGGAYQIRRRLRKIPVLRRLLQPA